METKERQQQLAFTKMAQLCSRAEYCESDIRKKITAFSLSPNETEEVISKLRDENFLNDERYVKAYISDKFRINRWGKIKLRYSLKIKGLPNDVIENGLDEIDDEKYKNVLVKTLKDKAKTVKKKNKFEKMGQVIRHAQSRGFEPELIHRYLNLILE